MRNVKLNKAGINALVIGMLCAMLWVIGCWIYLFYHHEMISKLMKAARGNYLTWITIFLMAAIALYWKLKDNNEYTWGEFAIVCVVIVVATFGNMGIFYVAATDIKDTEVWNGRIMHAKFHEHWTEETESCSTDSDGKETCTKNRTYHSDYWVIHTSNGEKVRIGRHHYAKLVARFGNNPMVFPGGHSNQISHGDGRIFKTSAKNVMIPTAVEHSYVNYLRASQSIKKLRGNTKGYERLLMRYPRTFAGNYGRIELNRVLIAGTANVPGGWRYQFDTALDHVARRLGSRKQCNIIVYVVASGQGFFQALRDHWVEGKKNDIVVVIGSNRFPSIDWVQVMAWTEVAMFKVQLAARIKKIGSLRNYLRIKDVISSQIDRPAARGGYVRMPMAKLSYLLTEIGLPFWAKFLVLLLNLLVVLAASMFAVSNDWKTNRWSLRRNRWVNSWDRV